MDRLTFAAAVWIRAEPERVFALVSDLRRKATLNPNIEVIRVELESDEPIREGSVFYHRFQKGRQIVEYRSRCVRFVPPRLFESRGQTDPPFEVRVTVEPAPEGCRLTQQEMVEVTPALLDFLAPVGAGERAFGDVVSLLALFPAVRQLGAELRRHQLDRAARRLTAELQAWLDAIKAHLEAPSPTPLPRRGRG